MIILPDKHMNLELSVINVAAKIIKKLGTNEIMKYDELLQHLVETMGIDAKFVFPTGLGFLFLLKKITYNKQLDTFELIR